MEGIQVSAYSIGDSGDISFVQVGGYIDNVTSSQLEIALNDVISQGVNRVIIDLASVSYISSAGWGVFLGKIKGLRENGGDLIITRMIPDVADVFELLEFHRVLKVFETSEEAVAHFENRPIARIEKGTEDKSVNTIVVEEGVPESRETASDITPLHDIFSAKKSENDPPIVNPQDPPRSYATELLSRTEMQDDEDVIEPTQVGESTEGLDEGRNGDENIPASSFYDSLGMSAAVMDRDLPLSEKVKLLVIDNPLSGIWKIKRALNSSRFGYTKVGTIEIRNILKELDLDSKEKRYRFWRSR